MCGIYGVVSSVDGSRRDAGERVMAGLKRLEYRGYDSWGVAVVPAGVGAGAVAAVAATDLAIAITKEIGKIGQAEAVVLPEGEVAIGHTRWATHGGVTQVNAHPHLASDGSFALVQNGVVENYLELKAELVASGARFVSETDTEVIVRLLERELALAVDEAGAGAGALTYDVFARVMKLLEGRSTVVVVFGKGSAAEVWGYRSGSPFIVGRQHGESGKTAELFLSSDVTSLSVDASHFIALENGEVVHLSQPSGQPVLEMWSADGKPQAELQWQVIDHKAMVMDKAGYDHFMLKEIHEQPAAWLRVVASSSGRWEGLAARLRQARRIYTLGSGSASFAAGQLAWWWRQAGLDAQELQAYEASSYRSLWQAGDVCVVISQSGETADTNEVVEWLKAAGVTIVALVNMSGSSLARLADETYLLGVGPEIGVASTKALTGQLVWGWGVAQAVAGRGSEELESELTVASTVLSEWLKSSSTTQELSAVSGALTQTERLFILGRGALYYPAKEVALKLKEVSYLHAEAFSGGELKHGVIALIEPSTPVMCLVADDEERAAMLNAVAEIKARGAHVIGVSSLSSPHFDSWIKLPALASLAPLAAILPAQLLTYSLALTRGNDPDKPRNLAKSVTVK